MFLIKLFFFNKIIHNIIHNSKMFCLKIIKHQIKEFKSYSLKQKHQNMNFKICKKLNSYLL